MSKTSPGDIRKILSNVDKALLIKDFLSTLYNFESRDVKVPLSNIYDKMSLGAFNLTLVMPVILDDYLIHYGLVEKDSNGVKITDDGTKILQQITKPETSLSDVMELIDSKEIRSESSGYLTTLLNELIHELRQIYRPRVFFDIVPARLNMLNFHLRNSGRSPAFNISCSFNPDLPYYDDTSLSSLPILKNLPFLEDSKEISFYYNTLPSILEDSTFPKETNVRITYADSDKNIYSENYIINLERYRGTRVSDTADLRDIHEDLDNIRKVLDNIQRQRVTLRTPVGIKKKRTKIPKQKQR